MWLTGPWSGKETGGSLGPAVMTLDEGVDWLPFKSLCTLSCHVGRFNLPMPFVETFIAPRALRRVGLAFADDEAIGVSTLAEQAPIQLRRQGEGYVAPGVLHSVAWGRHCTAVLVSAQLDGRPCLALLATPESVEHRANLAGEPRDRLRFRSEEQTSELQ